LIGVVVAVDDRPPKLNDAGPDPKFKVEGLGASGAAGFGATKLKAGVPAGVVEAVVVAT